MKLATIERNIKHVKPLSPIELPPELDMFCAEIEAELREEYIMSHEQMLREINPAMESLMVCGDFAIMIFPDGIEDTNVAENDRKEITRKLIRMAKNRKEA